MPKVVILDAIRGYCTSGCEPTSLPTTCLSGSRQVVIKKTKLFPAKYRRPLTNCKYVWGHLFF